MKFDLSKEGKFSNLPLVELLISLLKENNVTRVYEVTFDRHVKGLHEKRNVVLNESAAQRLEDFVSLGHAYTAVSLTCSTNDGVETLTFGRLKDNNDIKALGDIIMALIGTYESLSPVSDYTSLIINNCDFIDACQSDLLDCLRVRLSDNDTVHLEELGHSVRLITYDKENNIKLSIAGNKNVLKLLEYSQSYIKINTYDLEKFMATGVDVKVFSFLSFAQVDLFNRAVRGNIEKLTFVDSLVSLSDEYFSVNSSGEVLAVIQVPCNNNYRDYLTEDHVTMIGKEVKVYYKENLPNIKAVFSEMSAVAENVICVKRQ